MKTRSLKYRHQKRIQNKFKILILVLESNSRISHGQLKLHFLNINGMSLCFTISAAHIMPQLCSGFTSIHRTWHYSICNEIYIFTTQFSSTTMYSYVSFKSSFQLCPLTSQRWKISRFYQVCSLFIEQHNGSLIVFI